MEKALATRAIDQAFTKHMETLFVRLCNDVEIALKAKVSTESAMKAYLQQYKYACVTHQLMSDNA